MNTPVRIAIAILLFVVLIFVSVWTTPYWTHGSKVVTVTLVDHKLMKVHGQIKDTYLVFTTDGTYENIDSPAYFKYNSSDLQGRLAQLGCFKIDYYGFRVPFLSTYKNITKAERAACPAA